jgi:hypothetical protein
MRETNGDLSDRPRFSVVISEDGRRVGTLWESNAIRARSNFGAAVARYRESTINHCVELYDGPDLIETWSGGEGRGH